MKKRDEAYADRLFGYVLWNEYLTGQSRQSIETLSDYMGIEFPFAVTENCTLVISGMERIAYRQYGVTAIDYDQSADRVWHEQIRPSLKAMGYLAEYTMEIYSDFKHLIYILRPGDTARTVPEAVLVIHDALQRAFLGSFLPEDSPHGNFTVYAEGLNGQAEILEAFTRLHHMHGYTFFGPKTRIYEAGALEKLKGPDNEGALMQAVRDYTSAVYDQKTEKALTILREEIGSSLRYSFIRELCRRTMNNLHLNLMEIHSVFELPAEKLQAATRQRHNSFDSMLDAAAEMTEKTIALLAERNLTYSPVVRSALLYLRAHFASDLQLSDVAEYAGVSPSYLSRMFNLEVGSSLPTYLLHLRIEEASRALVTTKDTVSAISRRCGFSSPGYFCRRFRQEVGASPAEYRAEHQPR